MRGYRFHDHRAADASGRFLTDLDAAIAVCDEAAYNAARERWLARTYDAEAQARRSTAFDAAHADSAAKREQDAAELERLYRERPRYPRPCPPQTAAGPFQSFGGKWAMVTAGRGATELPTTGIGFQRPSGEDERLALETAYRFDTRRLGVEASFGWAGLSPSVIGLEYGEGDSSTMGEAPAGTGIETGIVFNALSPSGSSGYNVGDRGSQNTTMSEFDYWHLYAKGFLPGDGPIRLELSSREHNQANFGPMSDRDFRIERERSADVFGVTGTFALGVEHALTQRLSLGFGGHITTLEEVGAVYNPQSGDEAFFEGREVDLASGRATT
ncbi:hypothetical protein [Brevundimonas sp.]|uniref:hypothetical protein n=1 Tax=Brevundimonas sp. TaxID=1871086 RepID=UPI002D3CBF7A|nr:hypothetical protein [Brevundimonas sp.]HYC73212.1 hypothetical protein [Brevundimonas sp.]